MPWRSNTPHGSMSTLHGRKGAAKEMASPTSHTSDDGMCDTVSKVQAPVLFHCIVLYNDHLHQAAADPLDAAFEAQLDPLDAAFEESMKAQIAESEQVLPYPNMDPPQMKQSE